jgi:hypothetical protein
MPEAIFMKLGSEPISIGVNKNDLFSVIPTLQPFRLLRQNLSIA